MAVTARTRYEAPGGEPGTSVDLDASLVADAPGHRATIRPLRPGDDREIRRIWRETLVMGRPMDVPRRDLAAYEEFALEWYLTTGRATCRVAEQDGAVKGYLLLCLDQNAFDRWSERAAVVWGAQAAIGLASGRYRGEFRRFVRARLVDGWRTWRDGTPRPFPAHAHINLEAGIRDGGIGHRMAATIDQLVEEAGLPGWFGELNLPAGRSTEVFERAGARVVHRLPSATFTWLLGVPVERCTIARPLASRTDSVTRRGG